MDEVAKVWHGCIYCVVRCCFGNDRFRPLCLFSPFLVIWLTNLKILYCNIMFKTLKQRELFFFVCQNSNHLFSLELTKQTKKINIYFVNLNLN